MPEAQPEETQTLWINPVGPPKGEVRLSFESGTLCLQGWGPDAPYDGSLWQWDARVSHWRALGSAYRQACGELVRGGWRVGDGARGYEERAFTLGLPYAPYEHQAEALGAWDEAGRRGVVILPTGAGKTFVAQLAIEAVGRDTLVVVPTLDLLNQWSGILEKAFGQPIGLLGGGYHEILPITVSTYDSAAIHMDRLGHRFGMVVFDEVHHLPGEVFQLAAQGLIAPFRLGLTATYERADGRQTMLDELVGPVAYRKSIKEMSGHILADYEVKTVEVEMTPEDLEAYTEARAIYRGFVTSQGIRLGGSRGWQNFLAATSKSSQGRQAFKAYQRQKSLALVHQRKLEALYRLVEAHHDDRVLIFTNDNASVYAISEAMLCPSITHQTPIKERKEILAKFNQGLYGTVVTSKVLNEGVDVPEASVAIILSGSGSVREHVQRLGRILRRTTDQKQALLYELVTQDSVEQYVSQRRREHDAYQ